MSDENKNGDIDVVTEQDFKPETEREQISYAIGFRNGVKAEKSRREMAVLRRPEWVSDRPPNR